VFTVTDIADGKAVLDWQSSVGGQEIAFRMPVLEVRPATAEELEHGHVHGAGGHHHH
jgi:FKBP-type peptidyl-prolyl cis-trans isomerase SlyD